MKKIAIIENIHEDGLRIITENPDYSYEIIDTKNSSKVKGDHIYQLGVYVDLIKDIQGILPEKFYILLKDNLKQ